MQQGRKVNSKNAKQMLACKLWLEALQHGFANATGLQLLLWVMVAVLFGAAEGCMSG